MKYPAHESANLEFKRTVPEKQQIINTVIAFCNQQGGRLILGVEDNRNIIGVPENEANTLIDTFQETIYKSCTPAIIPSIYAQRIADKVIIIIDVAEGMNKPYYRSKHGLSNGVYVRIGTCTMKASPEIVQALQWQSRGYSPDEIPLYAAQNSDINDNAFSQFIQSRNLHTDTADTLQDYKLHYRILRKEHQHTYPTTAGMLLFGNDPQHFVSEAFFICTHFKGTSGREVLATRDCTGTLFQQFTDCMAFLESRLNKQFTIQGKAREESLEIPINALREIILNAIVHRDYQIPGPSKVAIYDDRVEIFSPGSFPGPIDPSRLEMGLTYLRNKIIGRIFRESKLIEKLGSGFLTLFKTYREQQLPEPTIVEGAGFIKCLLPRPFPETHKTATFDPMSGAIMQLLQSSDRIVMADVLKTLNCSRQTAVRVLNRLIETRHIERLGKGRSTYYIRA